MNLNSAKRLVNKIRVEKDRPNWPMPIQYIGGGVDGKVYLTDNGKLMKITFDADPQEFRGLAKLQNTGLVPSFNKRNWVIIGKSKKGTKMTAFLMGKVGGPDDQVMTLDQYKKTKAAWYGVDWRAAVSRMIRKMHMKGVSHGNLHENNILVVITPEHKVKFFIIDFGRSMFFPVGMTEREFYAPMARAPAPGPLFMNKKHIPHRANVHMAKLFYENINRPSEHRIRTARRIVNTKKVVKSPSTKVYATRNNNLLINAGPKSMAVNVKAMKLTTANTIPKTLAKLRKLTNIIPRRKKIN